MDIEWLQGTWKQGWEAWNNVPDPRPYGRSYPMKGYNQGDGFENE